MKKLLDFDADQFRVETVALVGFLFGVVGVVLIVVVGFFGHDEIGTKLVALNPAAVLH